MIRPVKRYIDCAYVEADFLEDLKEAKYVVDLLDKFSFSYMG